MGRVLVPRRRILRLLLELGYVVIELGLLLLELGVPLLELGLQVLALFEKRKDHIHEKGNSTRSVGFELAADYRG